MSKEFHGQPIKDLRGYMKESEVKKLLDGASSLRDKALLRLLWATGARISEIVGDHSWYKEKVFEGAKVEDIDFDESVIILDLLKRKQYPPPKHRVPLDAVTLQILREHITSEKLLPKDKLFPITRQRAFQIIRQIGREVGIETVGSKKIHNHHLRHSHCIAYIRKNNSMEGLRKLQQNIGHANINTTAGYLQFGLEERKETEDVFGKW